MKKILSWCWFVELIVLLSLGFEAAIWYLITPVTISVAQLTWLESVVRIGAVICSILYTTLIKFL